MLLKNEVSYLALSIEHILESESPEKRTSTKGMDLIRLAYGRVLGEENWLDC